MKSVLLIAGLCALLCGCMGVKQEEYYWAHFGPYPTNYHDLVTEWVEKNFEEPRGVYVSSPARVRFPKPLFTNGEKVYGWCTGVSLESKGTFDTYTPRKYYHLYLRDGKIVSTVDNNTEQPRTRGIAQVPYFR
jgi:hypothetical protein